MNLDKDNVITYSWIEFVGLWLRKLYLINDIFTYELFEIGAFISEHGRFCLHAPLRTKVTFLLWHLIISNRHLFGYVIPSEAHTAFSLSVVREQALGAQIS